jgi:hypothetical protein
MNFGVSSFYHATTVGAGSSKVQGFFFAAKKRAGESNNGIFENSLKKHSPYFEENKVKIRQI